MKLTKREEAELAEWGIRFFEMGYTAAFNTMKKTEDFSRDLKIKDLRKYIKEIIDTK